MDRNEEDYWLPQTREFERSVQAHPALREVRAAQAKGSFTETPIILSHYAGAVALLHDPDFVGDMARPVRVLDFGAYLNLFANFLNGLRPEAGKAHSFAATGVERDPEYCELSSRLFDANRVIQDDARRPSKLGGVKADVVVFCNFFHFDSIPSRSEMESIFRSVDAVLEPGGLILNRHAYRGEITPSVLTLHPIEGGDLGADELLPDGYEALPGPQHEVWNVVRKRAAP